MGNLSKQQRDKMIQFINNLRVENTDDTSAIALNEIESFIQNSKFGLIWEEHSEKVDEALNTRIPVFTELKDRKINKIEGNHYNFLLEGDNLHSLYLLKKTHKGKIDVIYIDPPYNTGNKDFKYDDDYVDSDDSYKHSKWLSFMYRRLTIARDLLSNDGIIFMSIDDNEQSQLKMLADSVFGEDNFIICMPRQTKKSGKTTGSFSKNHDYVLVYTNKNQDVFEMRDHIDENYKNEDEYIETRGKYKLNQTLDYDSLSYSSSLDYPLEIEGEIFYPGGSYEKYLERKEGKYKRADWAWRWNKKLFEFGYNNGFIVIKRKKDGTARIYTKTYLNAKIEKDENGNYYIDYVKKKKAMSSIELTENKYSNDRAKRDLAVFGLQDEFDYSKPVELIKTLIQCHKNKDAIVLDFFAGSGTTGQATLHANLEDGGNRRFILCTDNENNICEDVTYKRLKDVILTTEANIEDKEILLEQKLNMTTLKKSEDLLNNIEILKKEHRNNYDRIKVSFENNKIIVYGITFIQSNNGIPANLKYFRTGFVEKFDNKDKIIADELIDHITEMIELENHIEIDGVNNIFVSYEEELDKLFENDIKDCQRLYLPTYLLLDKKQMKIITEEKIKLVYIPDYYFSSELREVGEL